MRRASAITCQSTPLRALAGDRVYWAALLAALPAVVFLAWITGSVVRPHRPDAQSALLLVVVAPVLEEIVFRAGLQELLAVWLPGRVGPLTVANGLTGVAFALSHLLRHPPGWALATAIPALAFGYFYERHDRRLVAPIGLHAFYNAAYLVLLV